MAGSLALIADAGHMLTDVAGLLLSLLAIGFTRRPATPQKTYGFYRMEILATLTNSVVLISISFYIIYEAYQRIFHPQEVQGIPVISYCKCRPRSESSIPETIVTFKFA